MIGERRRRAALGFASGVGIILPLADTYIDPADRATTLGCYSDVVASFFRESFSSSSNVSKSAALNSHATRSETLNSRLDD